MSGHNRRTQRRVDRKLPVSPFLSLLRCGQSVREAEQCRRAPTRQHPARHTAKAPSLELTRPAPPSKSHPCLPTPASFIPIPQPLHSPPSSPISARSYLHPPPPSASPSSFTRPITPSPSLYHSDHYLSFPSPLQHPPLPSPASALPARPSSSSHYLHCLHFNSLTKVWVDMWSLG